jgi:hypothetical protein
MIVIISPPSHYWIIECNKSNITPCKQFIYITLAVVFFWNVCHCQAIKMDRQLFQTAFNWSFTVIQRGYCTQIVPGGQGCHVRYFHMRTAVAERVVGRTGRVCVGWERTAAGSLVYYWLRREWKETEQHSCRDNFVLVVGWLFRTLLWRQLFLYINTLELK